MQKNNLVTSLLLSLIFIAPAFAEKSDTQFKDFKVGTDTVHTFVPYGWTDMEGMLNVPITLVSKKGNQDIRSVIQIVPYSVKDEKEILAKAPKDPVEYRSQKEDWLKDVQGQSIAFMPYQETKDKENGSAIYTIGMKYSISSGDFLDQTYFVSSKSKHLYFIKALIPLDRVKEDTVSVNDVVNAISAKN